ncbi:hypothetical protein PRZ48_006163 [Zasmidium cellare]|uniref:Major facilitator superfamily (MFS) profile domain-containing protein n=1 Tax=Zasmidium cellare TaxID=395010 RepID=A0ABR0EML3_ZASCE|nr:hypothetical protein PRZ48_006163 [Zasmidium cellare]
MANNQGTTTPHSNLSPGFSTTSLHTTKEWDPEHDAADSHPTSPATRLARDDFDEKLEKGSEPSINNEQAAATSSEAQLPEKSDATTDPHLVEWDGPEDPENPQNWPRWRKWRITCTSSMMAFVCTFASSIFSTASTATAKEFGVSTEIPMFFGYAVFAIFEIPVAVAQNLQTIMVCRFFGGAFAVAPLVILPGVLGDMWDPVTRGIAMCLYSASLFVSPSLSPFIGGFITDSYLGWRWTAWITLIMAALFGSIALVTVPETYAPVLLQRRAKRLRFQTKNWALHSKFDETEVKPMEVLTKFLIRPCKMLAQEPVLFLMTLYLSLVYGLLYLTFESFPVSFQEQRGWNEGVGGLPYLSFSIGAVLGLGFNAWFIKTHYGPIYRREGKVPPEERLLSIMLGAFVLPIGLFWFAAPMYHNLTTPWASSLLAFLALALAPVPFLFYKYGAKLRK